MQVVSALIPELYELIQLSRMAHQNGDSDKSGLCKICIRTEQLETTCYLESHTPCTGTQ